jgi:imidazolonepropionase-like amidohydrolase
MKSLFQVYFVALVSLGVAIFGPTHANADSPVYLTGGHLVDVVRGEIYEDIGVLIEHEKITGLFFDFDYNENRIPEDAVRVDVSGKYLIPGMIDLHAHAYTQIGSAKVDLKHFFKMFLAGGVTTVRAMSPDIGEMIRVKLEIDAGRSDGPNIITGSAPAMEQAPGFPKLERTAIVNNAIEARELVRDHALSGAEWIKFYNYGDADVVGAVVDEAHRHGRKVFGHFATLGAADASRLGVDSLEHTVSLLQKSLDYEDSISLTDIGYYRLFALWPKVNEEKLDEIFKVLVENGTAVVPTLAVQAVVAEPEEMNERSSAWFDLYQPSVHQAYLENTSRVPTAYDFSDVLGQWSEAIEVQARHMARFVNMGGKVGTGSDLISAPPLVPGLSIHQELEYFVEGGMTPLQALRSATITAAEILGWDDQFGSIEIGKQADIVAIDGNPLADIKAVYNIDTVVQAGNVYRIDELKQELRDGPTAK